MALDPLYWSTSLVLNFEGANNSTSFPDISPSPKTATVNGDAKITTSAFKTGSASGIFDGTGDYLSYASDPGFDFGTGDGCVELWWNPAGASTDYVLAALCTATVSGLADAGFIIFHLGASNAGKIRVSCYSGTNDYSVNGLNALVAGTWYHIAMVRRAGQLYLYIDGVLQNNTSAAGALNTPASRFLRIGYYNSAATRYANGKIDGFRITKGDARYTAAFTPSTALFEASIGETATAALTSPVPAASATLASQFPLTAPAPTIAFNLGIKANLGMPMPTIDFTAHDSTGDDVIQVIAPMPTVSMRMGLRAAVAAPMPTIDMDVTTTTILRVAVTAPMPRTSIRVTSVGLVSIAAQAPMARVASRMGNVIVGSIPMPSVAMRGTAGSVIRVSVVVPMAEVDFNATSEGWARVHVDVPMPVPGPWGYVRVVAPMARVEFIARSVVVVTYEAYAVNLKPGPKMPNQVTRYTDYPFNQIVRFKGRYLGVADDGLYELGGDTDYDATTPANPAWSWHTGETDFNSPQLKNVREAIFAGRLGPKATASVSVREAADRDYIATIVRGTAAQNHRIKYGRGLKARYWSFGWSDPAGGECETDVIQFDAAELGRKL